MKIISWNLKNISNSKLSNTFSQKFIGFGLGNDVGDYITGLIMGCNRWNSVPNLSTDPADVFVVIELKTGGERKGSDVSGNCIPTLQNLVTRLNTLVKRRYPGKSSPSYQYAYVTPLVIGYRETVGVIYNKAKLQYLSSRVERNTKGYLCPRSVFSVDFETRGGKVFTVAGLHAPPPSGGADTKYRAPINYSNLLYTIPAATTADTFFVGDFNTDPSYSYPYGSGKAVRPFYNLAGFSTKLPGRTLSSVRTSVNNYYTPPANYLSDALDNIIFNASPPGSIRETVVDMIGQARDMNRPSWPGVAGTNLTLVFNAFNVVSDHLPVVIEF